MKIRTTPVWLDYDGDFVLYNLGSGTLSFGATTSCADGTVAVAAKLGRRDGVWVKSDTTSHVEVDQDLDFEWGGMVKEGDLVLNVRDYAALGDGVTDDTTAVQAAINDASAAPGQVRVYFPRGTYLIDRILLKAGVWLDFGDATIKQRGDLETQAFIRTADTLTLGSYYGTYDDIKITGGFIDPDEKVCAGALFRILWTRNLVIEGVNVIDFPPPPDGASYAGCWAFNLGGQNGRISGCRIEPDSYGTALNNDGIHVIHGTRWRIEGNDIECGDDAIAIGGVADEPTLVATPESCRYITVKSNVVKAHRGAAFKAFVPADQTGTNWEVTNIVVDGLTGEAGISRNGGITIYDFNLGAAGAQVRRVRVSNVSLDVGSTTHDETNAYGIWLQSVKDVTVEGSFKLTDKTAASTGFNLVACESSQDVKLELFCDALAKARGVDIDDSSRIRLVNSTLRATSALASPAVHVDNSDVRVVDCDILDVPSGQDGLKTVNDSSLMVRGTKVAHAAGAGAGGAFNTAATTTLLHLADNDLTGAFSVGYSTGNITTFIAHNNRGVTQTYAATNVSADRAFDANSTTTDELADVLGTLIADLRAGNRVV